MAAQMDSFAAIDTHDQVHEPQKIHDHVSLSDIDMGIDSKHEALPV